MESGGVLLSRAVASQVPSALRGLTSVFGMGTGGTLSPLPPEIEFYSIVSALLRFPLSPLFWPTLFYAPLQLHSSSWPEHYFALPQTLYSSEPVCFTRSPLTPASWLSPRPISITKLHTLLHFHRWPINLVVCKGSYLLSQWESSSWGGLHA